MSNCWINPYPGPNIKIMPHHYRNHKSASPVPQHKVNPDCNFLLHPIENLIVKCRNDINQQIVLFMSNIAYKKYLLFLFFMILLPNFYLW